MASHRTTALAAASVVLALMSAAHAQLRSFGDAEGYGAAASGGRGITAATSIYHVTNLNDSGAGSLRDAVSGSNRIVVFDVAGEIKLSSGISSQGNITIAGQTAPGEGITITGYQAIGFTNRSNIIMRYVRLRPGDSSPASDNGMSMTDTGTAILDHVSIEFGKYNNIDAVSSAKPHITIQHSIIADPISTGTSTRGQGFGAHLEAVDGYYTISNNLWANSHSRNPLAKVNDQFKNNVEYNNEIGYLTSGTSTPFDHDVVNNAFIYGPASTSSADFGQLSTPDQFYQSGNVQDTNKNGVFDPTATAPLSDTDIRRSLTPLHASTNALPTLSAADAYAYVLAHAGSSLSRDQLDSLVIGQVQTLGQGTWGYTAGTTGPIPQPVPSDPVHDGLYYKANLTGLANNGLGFTAASSRYNAANNTITGDVDKDGVADAWELTHGMNPADASDAVKKNALGYLMIEQYINELGDQNATAAWTFSNVAPGPYTHATIRGTGGNSVNMTFNTTPTVAAAPQALSLQLGGNGAAGADTVNVVAGGRLNVYDTITVGDQGNATLNVNGGTVAAWNVQLGNTDFSTGVGVSYTGNLNLNSGTLNVSQIASGAGAPGAFTSGGTFTWNGGTVLAAGGYSITAPTVVTNGVTLDDNSNDGQLTALSGIGTITKNGTGTLTLTGNNSAFSGPIKLTKGAVTLATTGANSSTGVITLSNGTTVNVSTSNTTTPIAVATGATATLVGNGNTYGGTISGPAGSTLAVSTASTGTSNFSLGGSMATFAGTLDLAASTGNLRINQGGSALANFDLGDSTGLLRVAFGGTVNLGSLAGVATTKLQGATNDAVPVTFVVGANGNSTTFAGTVSDGTFTTPGIVNVTKSGTGTLALTNAASTYSGATSVTGGVLSVATLANGLAASSIGDSSNAAANLVLDGGRLRHTGGAATIDRGFTLGANGGGLEASGTAALVLNSTAAVAMSGTGDRTLTLGGTNTAFNGLTADLADPTGGKLSLTKEGAGTWRLLGNAKTYSGNTAVNGGTLYLVGLNQLASGAGRGDVSVAAGATLDMYGNSQQINGLNGLGTVTTTLNTARTLTVGAGDASGDFGGTLTQGGSQTLALTKTGTGTQTLSGTNLYTGATTVSGGKLIVNGSIANSATTVQSNATLAGIGALGGVTVNAGGTLAPGNSIGTLTAASVTLRGTLAVEVSGAANAADRLTVAGALDLTGGTLALTTLTTPDDPAYVLATYGTLAGTFGSVVGLPSGYALNYAYNDGTGANHVALVAAVPEPTTLAALAAAAPLVLLRRRRRA